MGQSSVAQKIPSRRDSWLGLGVVALVFVIAAMMTWRKWPDFLVDFGLQLYIPWRILHGAVLYRDLFYYPEGPFSQYFNALLFKIFGVSFSTLIVANLTFAAAMILVVYRYFLKATDVWAATLIAVVIITVFAFAQLTLVGNYNFVAPYSHGVTHGVILSVFAIALLSDWIRKGNVWTAAVAGLCAGIVFLTKPDIFLALALTVLAAFALRVVRSGAKGLARSLPVFLAAAMVPSLFFLVYFLHTEDLRNSARSTVFGWLSLVQGNVTKNQFYRWCTGLDAPWTHLREIILYFSAVALAVAVYGFATYCMGRFKWPRERQWAGALIMITPLLIWLSHLWWYRCGWPLPLLSLSACLLLALNFKKLEEPVFPLLWSLFGLALLAKLGLYPRIWHYGFALAMPAFVSSVYLLFWLLPRLLERQFATTGIPFRLMAGLVLVVGCANLVNQSEMVYAQKTLPIGSGGDEIITYNAASEVSQGIHSALLWTQEHMPRNATLAVMPEGITFNYLTRHVNPTPCLEWDPAMLGVFGQTCMTDAIEKNPPDYIFIVERVDSEYGVRYFGSTPDFGLGLMQWIQTHYETEVLIGHEPLKNGLFGIKILKRVAEPSAVNPPKANDSGGGSPGMLTRGKM